MKLARYEAVAALGVHRRRVDAALRCIAEAAGADPFVSVSVSGGKDSSVCLDLAIRALGASRVRAVHFDCGTQLAETAELLARAEQHYSIPIERVRPRLGLVEALKAGNYWGYTGGDDAVSFDFRELLVCEPSRRHRAEHGWRVNVLGLRGQESRGRALRAARYGDVHVMRDGEVRVCPIQSWRVEDVWGYLTSRRVPYNRAYDRMQALGVTVEEMRVGSWIGPAGASRGGRFVWLRLLDPARWNEFSAEFPLLKRYA